MINPTEKKTLHLMTNPTEKKTLHLMTSSTWPNLPIWPSDWQPGDERYYGEICGRWSTLYSEASGWHCSPECLPPNNPTEQH